MSREEELALWRRYKENRDVQAARELYQRMRPLIASRVNPISNRGVPTQAAEAEARRLFKKALDEYNPDRGAALGTFVVWNLKRMDRWANTYQNIGYIPDPRSRTISMFNDAKSHLEMVLGREPTTQELSEDLKWDMTTTARLERELRKDLSLSSFQEQGVSDDDRQRQGIDAISFVYQSLPATEKRVMEYLTGRWGKPKLDRASDIARRVGVSEATVSRIRRRIENEIKKFGV